jgi:hypothetical protein
MMHQQNEATVMHRLTSLMTRSSSFLEFLHTNIFMLDEQARHKSDFLNFTENVHKIVQLLTLLSDATKRDKLMDIYITCIKFFKIETGNNNDGITQLFSRILAIVSV